MCLIGEHPGENGHGEGHQLGHVVGAGVGAQAGAPVTLQQFSSVIIFRETQHMTTIYIKLSHNIITQGSSDELLIPDWWFLVDILQQ